VIDDKYFSVGSRSKKSYVKLLQDVFCMLADLADKVNDDTRILVSQRQRDVIGTSSLPELGVPLSISSP
jgi:hypothetical protein